MAPAPAPPVHRTSSTSNTSFGGKRPEDEDLKPYVIVGDLGKGSFATVYKGYHQVRLCPPLSSAPSLFLACDLTVNGMELDAVGNKKGSGDQDGQPEWFVEQIVRESTIRDRHPEIPPTSTYHPSHRRLRMSLPPSLSLSLSPSLPLLPSLPHCSFPPTRCGTPSEP